MSKSNVARKQLKEKRFERWLVNSVAYMRVKQGVEFDLVTVGERLGDHLVARGHFDAALCEFLIVKK